MREIPKAHETTQKSQWIFYQQAAWRTSRAQCWEGRTIATGTVKWFNNAKGYGFILPSDGGGDLFAHYTAIKMEGYKTLKAGQEVVFDVEEGPKGHHAVNIHSEFADDD